MTKYEDSIQDMFTIAWLDYSLWMDMPDETVKAIKDAGYELDEEGTGEMTMISYADACRYGFVEDLDECCSWYWDDDGYEAFLDEVIKDADHYLVFNSCANWRHASAYKIVDSKAEIFERDYQVTQTITYVTRGHKAIAFTESSHDVPMGAVAIAVALTNAEYEKIHFWDFDGRFEKIRKFAEVYDR